MSHNQDELNSEYLHQTEQSSLESFDGVHPKCGQHVFVHRTAAVIGQVELGDRVSIWPQVTLRADEGAIKIGEDSNIQDGTTVHMTGGYSETVIGARVTVGHMCLLHGCKVGDDCLIGMGTILLDNCEIGAGSYVAAGTMITGGKKIPPNSFVMGRPGHLVIKEIPAIRQQEKGYSWRHYTKLASKYLSRTALNSLILLMAFASLTLNLSACQSLSPTLDQQVSPSIQKLNVTLDTFKQQKFYEYESLAHTEFDPFSHLREVIALTQNEPITINYMSFSAPKFDNLTKKAFTLYGQFRFAQNATHRFKLKVIKKYGENFLSQDIDQVQEFFNNLESDEATSNDILQGAKASCLAIQSHRDMVERAVLVKSELNSWEELVQRDVNQNGNLHEYLPMMETEVQRAQKLLDKVMGGAPLLAQSMKEIRFVVQSIDDQCIFRMSDQ